MTCSELVRVLNKTVEEHGDIEVVSKGDLDDDVHTECVAAEWYEETDLDTGEPNGRFVMCICRE